MTPQPDRTPVQDPPADRPDRPDFTAESSDPYCVPPDTAAELLRHHPWQRLAVLGYSVTAGVMDRS
ncbi:hypothetical protein ABZ621_33485 [Streptomyces sp. NPDC007863]|uniref:hypothetical protein n=1 Tax=Streptomyces sp. NPDC007863 TaxID=3154894 RepID=UPI0033E9F5FC